MDKAHDASKERASAPPETENRHPEWLAIEFGWGKRRKNVSELHLTIFFNRHRYETALGSLEFGLSGGELRLKLQNAEIPLSHREPRGTLPTKVKIQRTINAAESRTAKRARDVTASAGIGEAGAPLSVGGRRNTSVELSQSGSTAASLEDDEWLIASKGSQRNPIWAFAVKPGATVIEGSYDRFKLGEVHVQGQPSRAEATFVVLPRQLKILDASNSLANLALAKAKLFHLLLAKEWLGSYLSRTDLTCEPGGSRVSR